jgi:hypothetical protein
VPSNDWFDENGKEVFLPDKLPIKAYETTIEFVFKGTKGTAGTKIKSFLDYLLTVDILRCIASGVSKDCRI